MPTLADRDHISLSLHCETAEIMRAYTRWSRRRAPLSGLEAYSASRPPHSEGLAITIAAYLAHETELPNINLLHLSSRKAIEAAMMMQATFPHIDFRREVTIGHLLADIHTAANLGGKVNPPLRPREDVESLWEHLLGGRLRLGDQRPRVLPGRDQVRRPPRRRVPGQVGLRRHRVPAARPHQRGQQARPAPRRGSPSSSSRNPADRFGLPPRAPSRSGYDADFALVDDDASWVVHAEDSESTQEYTPFEGFEMTAKVTDTFVRGTRCSPTGRSSGTRSDASSTGQVSTRLVPENSGSGVGPRGRTRPSDLVVTWCPATPP